MKTNLPDFFSMGTRNEIIHVYVSWKNKEIEVIEKEKDETDGNKGLVEG